MNQILFIYKENEEYNGIHDLLKFLSFHIQVEYVQLKSNSMIKFLSKYNETVKYFQKLN